MQNVQSGQSQDSTQAWARLRDDVRGLLRRGAWYSILSPDGKQAAVITIGDITVSIPLSCLEITTTRPDRWTVVPRPSDAYMLPDSWGPTYAVCPNCADRRPLGRPGRKMRCSHCKETFEIG